jgi:hypothetical protein
MGTARLGLSGAQWFRRDGRRWLTPLVVRERRSSRVVAQETEARYRGLVKNIGGRRDPLRQCRIDPVADRRANAVRVSAAIC